MGPASHQSRSGLKGNENISPKIKQIVFVRKSDTDWGVRAHITWNKKGRSESSHIWRQNSGVH